MGFSCGLIGLPNAGKSTIFNALCSGDARVESYPFCTIEANVGTVAVPDDRLDRLSALYPDKKKVATHLEFVDVAGLVAGASEGEGMGNQFLSEIRSVDTVLHVVRCFSDPNVAHIEGAIDPANDIEVVETELLLKDYETLSRLQDRVSREARSGDRAAIVRADSLGKVVQSLAEGVPVRDQTVEHSIDDLLRDVSPLTAKPLLYVANAGDSGENDWVRAVLRKAEESGCEAVAIQGRIEAEVAEVAGDEEERSEYLREWGIVNGGLRRLIQSGYRSLSLVSFFTVEGPEVRAWTVAEGTAAPQAGAKIHTDFANRFVLAEVINLEELLKAGSERALREEGSVRRAGRDYVVADGDVIHFICS